jgi:hypothetical protein
MRRERADIDEGSMFEWGSDCLNSCILPVRVPYVLDGPHVPSLQKRQDKAHPLTKERNLYKFAAVAQLPITRGATMGCIFRSLLFARPSIP